MSDQVDSKHVRQLLISAEDVGLFETFLAFHGLEMSCIGHITGDDLPSWITVPVAEKIVRAPKWNPTSTDREGNPVFQVDVTVKLESVPGLMRILSGIVKIPGVLGAKVDDMPTTAIREWTNQNFS